MHQDRYTVYKSGRIYFVVDEIAYPDCNTFFSDVYLKYGVINLYHFLGHHIDGCVWFGEDGERAQKVCKIYNEMGI